MIGKGSHSPIPIRIRLVHKRGSVGPACIGSRARDQLVMPLSMAMLISLSGTNEDQRSMRAQNIS